MNNLINTKVYHGSPYYENAETIEEIYVEENFPEHKTIQFESGFFTRITHKDFQTFLKDGWVRYVRNFPDGKALESMSLA